MNQHLRAATIAIGISAAGFFGCGTPGDGPSSVPDRYPLGAVNRAHYQTMETNAEAADFILHRNEFVGSTTQLTTYGKDHLLEIAARAQRVPFPILVERSENNSDPKLDERRRAVVAQVLFDCGVTEAPKRTIVAPAYGQGLAGREAEQDFDRYAETGRTAHL